MNFDFLNPFPKFSPLLKACQEAERNVLTNPNGSGAAARRGLEFIVKFIYSAVVDDDIPRTLFEMADDERFKDYINDRTFLSALHVVRKMGNIAVHEGNLSTTEALNVLEQLHFLTGEFCVLIGLVKDYPAFVSPRAQTSRPSKPPVASVAPSVAPATSPPTTPAPVPKRTPAPAPSASHPTTAPVPAATSHSASQPAPQLLALYADRMRKTRFSVQHGRDETENKKLYLRACLREAGWPIVNRDNQALPQSAGTQMQLVGGDVMDYVLYGRDLRPLALIEFTLTNQNLVAGRSKALRQADLLAEKLGYRPLVYYTNGYHIFFVDQLGYPPRRVFQFHSLAELELLLLRAGQRRDISNPAIDDTITGRPYQKQAIIKTCAAFQRNRRHALLVMATGTGKTRVSISVVDVLMKAGWIKNALFLADRTSLVRQAHKNFTKLLPSLTTTIYSGSSMNRDPNARVIFSTYQTMINLISEDSREFGIGRFDLIIIDEAHRSIFKKYGALFHYFDALMLGLTATPRAEDNKNTYDIFHLKNGQPDFAYELEEAIEDGYLVGFSVLDKTTEKIRGGIVYDDLSEEEKRSIEDSFATGDTDGATDLSGTVLDTKQIRHKIINLGTIDVMLNDLMQNGLKIDGGDKLGKTIIFSRSHMEAEQIVLRFNHLYPRLGRDFCKLIDSKVPNSLQLIDSFGERGNLPQVAVSVDMLDTGIDVPDIVNLVFFKPVMSKIKFLQMTGRGTRLSPDLFGPGMDKQGFLVFDYYENFKYFSTHDTWDTTSSGSDDAGTEIRSQSEAINRKKLNILNYLIERSAKNTFEKQYLLDLRQYFIGELRFLNNDNVEVQQKMAYVSKYRTAEQWQSFNDDKIKEIRKYILPLLTSDPSPAKVKSFDLLILTMEEKIPGYIDEGKDMCKIRESFQNVSKAISERMSELLKLRTIPDIIQKEQLIHSMMNGDYLFDHFSLENCEKVRLALRNLMHYIPDRQEYYIINVEDRILDGDSDNTVAREKTYPEKVMDYLKNSHDPALAKLRNLDELSREEKESLKHTFTVRLGSAADYAAWSSNMPLLPFLRMQTGISDEAIKTKFGSFLQSGALNDAQLTYMRQIIDYARSNGDITFLDLQGVSPFSDVDVVALFGPAITHIKTLIDGLHKPVVM